MKRIATLAFAIVVGSTVGFADENKKQGELTAIEILKKVDEAAKKVKSATYNVTLTSGGALAARNPTIEASFAVLGYENGRHEKYYAEATLNSPGSSEARRVTAGTDYDNYFIVDHAGKIAYEDLDPIVMGPAGGLIQRAAMLEYVHDAPFSDEINARSQKLLGTKTVGGVECYQIHVVYQSDRAPEGTWCFSKKDFLPRQRTDHYSMADGQTGTRTKTITNLVVNPKLDNKTFALKLPDGFKKTDEFAPDFLSLRSGQ